MATDHYGLEGSGDLSLIDKLLFRGESHHHTGSQRPTDLENTAPTLELVPGSGVIPGGTTVKYIYTWVDPSGFESAVSREASISTAAPSDPPAPPELVEAVGQLPGGNYLYAISLYRTDDSRETVASSTVHWFVDFQNRTGVTITLPSVPSSFDGYNIYRRGPGEFALTLLHSTGQGETSWLDDGTEVPNTARMVPNRDTSGLSNSVNVTVPEPPAGYTWKLYRTYSDNWNSSLVSWVVDSGTFLDVGNSTSGSNPPKASTIPAQPSKIALMDGAEVEGMLPMGMAAYPLSVRLNAGETWVSEFPAVQFVSCRGGVDAPAGIDEAVSIYDGADVGVVVCSVPAGSRVGERQNISQVLNTGAILRAEGSDGSWASLYLIIYGYDHNVSYRPLGTR